MTTYSPAGLALTKSFEGCSLKSYRDSAGIWTIGWGHVSGVVPGMVWTQEQADAQLLDDIQWAVGVVNSKVHVPLNQNQFDALVDFCYNAGSGNFAASTLLRKVNAGDFAGAAAQFPLWVHAGGAVIPGLVRRREAEQALFELTPQDG